MADIAVEYGELPADRCEKIFLEFLRQLDDMNLVRSWDEVVEWVNEEGKEKNFNGRQIRNIVSTAMALAHAEGTELQRKHLTQVSKNTSSFKSALAHQEAIFKNMHLRTQYA